MYRRPLTLTVFYLLAAMLPAFPDDARAGRIWDCLFGNAPPPQTTYAPAFVPTSAAPACTPICAPMCQRCTLVACPSRGNRVRNGLQYVVIRTAYSPLPRRFIRFIRVAVTTFVRSWARIRPGWFPIRTIVRSTFPRFRIRAATCRPARRRAAFPVRAIRAMALWSRVVRLARRPRRCSRRRRRRSRARRKRSRRPSANRSVRRRTTTCDRSRWKPNSTRRPRRRCCPIRTIGPRLGRSYFRHLTLGR